MILAECQKNLYKSSLYQRWWLCGADFSPIAESPEAEATPEECADNSLKVTEGLAELATSFEERLTLEEKGEAADEQEVFTAAAQETGKLTALEQLLRVCGQSVSPSMWKNKGKQVKGDPNRSEPPFEKAF